MAVLTVRKEKVTLESLVEEPGQTSINHLDVQVQSIQNHTFWDILVQKDTIHSLLYFPSQGDHILVGTDRDMRLWGVEDRQKPKLLSTVKFYHTHQKRFFWCRVFGISFDAKGTC